MDRELLLEIGVEELPAAWLPGLTKQLAEKLQARLKEMRLTPDVADRELQHAAPPDGAHRTDAGAAGGSGRDRHRSAGVGRVQRGRRADARRRSASRRSRACAFEALERVKTDKGEYLAAKKHIRGKSTVDALPELLGALLRDLAFPKQMHWDAMLEDGKGELVFGRPIRWLLYLYGGRVVPFTIGAHAERGRRAGAGGHDRRGDLRPPLPGDERPRRTVDQGADLRRVPRAAARTFRDPRSLRAPRSDRARAGSQGAQAGRPRPSARAGGAARRGRRPRRVSRASSRASSSATSSTLPARSADDHARAPPALLPGGHRQGRAEGSVPGGREHAAVGRAADREERRARRHGAAARREVLLGRRSQDRSSRIGSIACTRSSSTRSSGSYRDKAERIEKLARTIAADVFWRRGPRGADAAATAARLAKADLVTDMVFEFPELQGADGRHLRARGRAARAGLEGDLLPLPAARRRSRRAAVARAARRGRRDVGGGVAGRQARHARRRCSTAGEKPTGSRDPFGLRRNAQGCSGFWWTCRS